jgi:hypothetical protein
MCITFSFFIHFLFNLRDLKCYKNATLRSTNNLCTIKEMEPLQRLFWVFGNSFPSVWWFFVSTIWPPLTLEGHIWLISSSFSTIQLSVGAQIVGLQFLFRHEIQRRTLQKFANLWDTKCSVIDLATLVGGKSRGAKFGSKTLELEGWERTNGL